MDKINFTINGEKYFLSGQEVSTVTSLNDFLRYHVQLHGTKAMCHEGGCGACVVSVSQTHPVTKEKYQFAVNSCMVHILSCHEWDITTVEGVGNRKDGYHAIQHRLASFNGTQCGYCTPGWVMNMYSLYKSSKTKLTTQQVENSFGGNLCRCTGYRPILDAFKSFANDADPSLKDKLQDVEDLGRIKCVRKCDRKCSGSEDDWCLIENNKQEMMVMETNGSRWYKAFSVQDVFKVLTQERTQSYELVAGNTGRGVYPIHTEPKILIDISSIETLKDSFCDANLVLGAGMTITEVMQLFQKCSTDENFKYLDIFHKHLDLVAHVPVRNIGSIGGNLALKNAHHDFPSDVYLLMLTVGATVTIVDPTMNKSECKIQDFLKMDLKDKIILDARLPPLAANYLIRTYKIMPRAQNAHAIVNAGFSFKVDSQQKVVSANIVLGNISPSFINAKDTETCLIGSELFSDETLLKALKKLSEEIVPVELPPEPSPFCRKSIALGLFYRAVLSLAPSVNPRYISGSKILERGVSQGVQVYDTDKSLWPLNEPVPKLEALGQCSGEVDYACDVPFGPRVVHAAFVLSTICLGEIDTIDASDALKIPGVLGFFTSKDIPGKNTFTPLDVPWQEATEEILASKKISYYGQPVGVIAATSHKLAVSAADLVKVKYKKSSVPPVLTIRQALVAPDKDQRMREEVTVTPTSKGTDTKHVIKGSYTVPSQYHFTMETQSCNVRHEAQGLVVRSATQWLDLVNVAVAHMLDVDVNQVTVEVPRVGGAYGGKASRSALPACACALVAHKLNRAANIVMPITHNMMAVGMRQQCEVDYEVGVNDEGVIQYLNVTYYSDCGCTFNDTSAAEISHTMANLYDSSTWTVKGYSVLTDKASCTWCRAPGTTEGIAIMEFIMERIAMATKKDPSDVRIANIAEQHSAVKDMITSFKHDVEFEDRRAAINKFNSDNAWKKKGMKLSIMSYPIGYSWTFPVTITVYHADGTVAISHGGIEMGQGINTKVAQVCAHTLKIPLEKVKIKGSSSFISPNTIASNGSMTSDCVAYATVKACEDLLKRFEDAKKDLNEPTWEEVVKAAFNKGINLQASYMTSPNDALVGYNVYGVCVAEVELDVLTGNHLLTRVDLLEDTGVSMSPEIDVGQLKVQFDTKLIPWNIEEFKVKALSSSATRSSLLNIGLPKDLHNDLLEAACCIQRLNILQIEGAFIMGLGLWTCEKLIYESSGRLLTNRTWTYKPPGAKDIPLDFRVSFRRNSPNPAGVLRSKATGEPALALAVVVTHALHEAVHEARKEYGYQDTDWIDIQTPYSVENIMTAISPKIESFKLK